MNINFNFLSIYSYTWYIHNTYNNIYQNLWFNIYLKYYFLHIYARNVYYYKITYHVSFERNIEIFISLSISKIYIFFPVLTPAYSIESESKWRVNFRLATAFLSSCTFPKRDRFRPSSLFLHASLCNVARN